MKLRNKKTGQEGNFIINKDHFECVDLDYVPLYYSLSGLLEEWEDYAPPLITDEKVRKAVRAWAEANECDVVQYDSYEDRIYLSNGYDSSDPSVSISFNSYFMDRNKELEHMRRYNIVELCGDEE